MELPEGVTAIAWDVDWSNAGFGKHGRGPFKTRRQAEACLRWHRANHALDGRVVQVIVTVLRSPKRGRGR